jgi:4-azaleucine resistance transporter AzlC
MQRWPQIYHASLVTLVKGDRLKYQKEDREPVSGIMQGDSTATAVGQDKKREALVGLIRAVPIILGYLPIGIAFGVLASTAGLSVYSATAMSIFVFAGSAQLISVGLIGAGASIFAITITVFLVNLRHLLMSASLAPYLKELKTWQQVLFSYQLTDESFAVHSVYFRQVGTPLFTQLFALNLSAQLAWVSGTVIGAWVGGQLTFDTEAYGIDFALPAMFIALLVMQIEKKKHLNIALLAAVLGLCFFLLGFSQLYIIMATIIAATCGALTDKYVSKMEDN